jgi:hypothetical protein
MRAKAYLAATVMQVAAFEAGLQAMCFLVPGRSQENQRPCDGGERVGRGEKTRLQIPVPKPARAVAPLQCNSNSLQPNSNITAAKFQQLQRSKAPTIRSAV